MPRFIKEVPIAGSKERGFLISDSSSLTSTTLFSLRTALEFECSCVSFSRFNYLISMSSSIHFREDKTSPDTFASYYAIQKSQSESDEVGLVFLPNRSCEGMADKNMQIRTIT